MKKLTLALVLFISSFFISSNVLYADAKIINVDGVFDDWDDVDILIDDTMTPYPYSGTIYYFDTDVNTWGTEVIADTCMYTQNRSLDIGALKLTNSNDTFYILWQRNSSFLTYYWRDGDATEQMDFDDDPAIDYENNPCVGEVITAPVAFDHDLVLSIDNDNNGSFDYYLVVNVSFDAGECCDLDTAVYLYEDDGSGAYSSGEEILVKQFTESGYGVSDVVAQDMGVLQEGNIR